MLQKTVCEPIRSIDPATIPYRRFSSGARMPAIGLGTFGSDHVSPQRVAVTVEDAGAMGYRHFDCASVYGNEDRIGPALRAIMQRGVNGKSCGSHRRSGTHCTGAEKINWLRYVLQERSWKNLCARRSH